MKALILTLISFLVSFTIQSLIIRSPRLSGLLNDCETLDKPQRFHYDPTPRAGGIGIFAGFVVALLIAQRLPLHPSDTPLCLLLLISSLPPLIAGLWEDIRSNTGYRTRLVVIATGAIIGIILLNSIVYDVGLFKFPLWFAIPFTIIAVTGVTNAINIIDGFNGLASGVSIISLISFALISYIHGDTLIFGISLILIGSIAGFFLWNFPWGKIFLGDGGAYLLGFILAQLSILLVSRNSDISPWFPLVILAHPIWETLFSIWRRKFKDGRSPYEPDRLHFHTLIYKRITKSHSKTSSLICLLVAFFDVIAFPFYSSTPLLILIFLIFTALYGYIYRGIVRFRPLKDEGRKYGSTGLRVGSGRAHPL